MLREENAQLKERIKKMYQQISDGVAKCKECGEPQYLSAPERCKNGSHWSSQQPIPGHIISVPSVFGFTPAPTVLELAKAIRRCFINGHVGMESLDQLIEKYDTKVTVTTVTTVDGKEIKRTVQEIPQSLSKELYEETGFGD